MRRPHTLYSLFLTSRRQVRRVLRRLPEFGKRILVVAIIFGWLFSPYVGLINRLGLFDFTPNEAKAAAGSFAVYRDAAGGESITTSVTNLTWDTTVVEGAGFSISGSDVTLSEAGHYLVLYNAGYESTSGTGRSEVQARIDQNGTDLPVGRSTCYFSRQNGVDECWLSGAAVIETGGASQTVRVETYRTDSNSAGVQRMADQSALQVLRLEDSWAFARYQEAGGGQSITGAGFASVDLDTNDEEDLGFTRVGNSITIANAGNYLVTYNVHMVDSSSGRRGNEFRLTVGGTEVEGTRTSAYLRGSDSAQDHVASFVGIVNATALDALVLEGRCNSASCSGQTVNGGTTGLTIAALPSAAEFIRLHESGGGQAVDATADPILWDSEDEEDAGSFSHDTMSNTSRMNIDANGSYLFLGSFYMDRSPLDTDSRLLPHWEWRTNGTTAYQYGSFAKHNRGDATGGGVGPSGASGGFIAYDLDAADYLELTNTDESSGTDADAVFVADRYAVQGVNIGTLFEGDATVSSRGSQTTSTLPGTTNLHIGGQFVITETGGSSRTVDAITITENGTVDAQNGLDNIRLYYETDTSAPYDCASESFSGFPTPSETQFGATDTDGFSGADGTSAFSDGSGPTINSTTTMCVYVVLDVLTGTAGDDIEIEITDPTNDVTVSAGTVGPGSIIPLNGTTNVDGKELRQMRYHWRNDDGDESGASAATSATSGTEDRYLRIAEGTTYRVRIEVSNEGTLNSDGEEFRLEYAELGFFGSDCAAAGGWTAVDAAGGHWDDSDSTFLTDGNNTTNIAESIGGVTDEGTFFSVAGTIQDVNSQTPTITINTGEMIEIEYSIEALAAATDGAMYCFRVTDAGAALDFYDIYPRIVIETQNDFHVQRGSTTIPSGSSIATIIAGENYFAPAALSNAFIRITNTHMTGVGENADDDTADNANTVAAYPSNPGNLLTSVQFNRNSSTDDTRIDWEIVEYQGPSGGVNEFIVRDEGVTNYLSGGTTVSQPVTGITDDNDVVPWITGQSNTAANTTEYHTGLSTSTWDGANNEIDFTRGTAGGNANTVAWALVEFTGSNWTIQRISHTYTLAGTTETEAPTTNFGATGSVFLHTQKRVNGDPGVDEFGHTVWVSATNQVSFELQGGASNPGNHVSVAFAIENTQTGGTPMTVTRSNGTIASGGSEPRTNTISIGTSLSDPSVASIFVNNRSAGSGTTYPDPMIAASLSSTTEYELWISESGNTKTYRTEVVEWPTAVQVFSQNYYQFYVDNDGLTPIDPWPAGGSDLAENTLIGTNDDPLASGDRVRIRMTIQMTGQILTASERRFDLQFAERVTTCSAIGGGSWNDVGNIGSGTIWRGYNGSPADGASVSAFLSVSDVGETYEEQNPTALNPNVINVTEDGEWDWIIENNGATPNSVYCFRMVQDDGSPLNSYNNYPQITTSDFRPESRNWRWYDDEGSETPTTDLALENTAPSDLAYNNTVKLRLTIAETGGLGATDIKFRLQFSEFSDFSDGGTFVAESGSCTEGASLWCYGNGADDDDDPILNGVLTDSAACSGGVGAGCGVHNESGISASAFDPVADTATEYEFTIRHAGARANVTYFFRAYDNTTGEAVPADSGETLPSLAVEASRATLTVSGVSSGTITEGVTTDVTTTATTVNYGLLNFDEEVEAAQTLSVDTNATEGYQVFVFEDQAMSNGMGGTVDPVTGTNALPSAWNTGCSIAAESCYGYHAGDDVLEGGSGRFATDDRFAQFSTTMEEVAYNGGPANESHDMVFKIEVHLNEDDGTFTNTLTYILVPVF